MKQLTIKAATGFRKMKPELVYNNSQSIYTALKGNTRIPEPPAPFDLATLLAANQALSTANVDALEGTSKAVAVRDQCKEVVVKILNQIAKYVEANCKDDITIFLSSGLKAQSSTKTATPPASDAIRYVKPGPISGQARVRLVADLNAGSYEVRRAPVPTDGVPAAWIIQPVVNIRSATVISGLTPGTLYAFQARSVTPSGYTDWSDSVTQMAM